MKIITGLGNPGKTYDKTRHNIGFLLVDMLRVHFGFEDWKESKHQSVISEGHLGDEKIVLMKPVTYMNLSGNAVSSMVRFYGIDVPNDLLIISDDIDMEFAKVRFREKGSHGGQNGLRNSIQMLGTNEFSRIKVGIGRDARYTVSDWVLSRLTVDELDVLASRVFPDVLELIEKWTRKG